MSAFGGKADMTIGTCPLSWSLSGVKRTWVGAAHMSAFDPKRTCPLRREYLSDAAFRAPNLAPCFLFEAQKRSRWHGTKIQLPAFSQIFTNTKETPNAHTHTWRPARFSDARSRTCTNQSAARSAGACCPVYSSESPWRDVAFVEAHRPQRLQRSGREARRHQRNSARE